MHDIQDLVDRTVERIEAHALDRPGEYARWLWNNEGGSRNLGPNEYGCADAANLLYMLGHFPADPAERASWIEVQGAFQEPATGYFREGTHHEIHTTAHCAAAMELFDAAPPHPLTAILELAAPERLPGFLDGLNWSERPWQASHQGAGLYAALAVSGSLSRETEDAYFGWLWEEADPESGFWRKGFVTREEPPLFHHLAGSFHYLFNHQAARRPLRYPEAMIDSCLLLRRDNLWPSLGKAVGFAEIDWVYCLTRPLRQCGHRFGEVMETLRAFADEFVAFLRGLDWERHDNINDMHMLFGAWCCLAELQTALPGTLRTDRPLKLVLDRRPFI